MRTRGFFGLAISTLLLAALLPAAALAAPALSDSAALLAEGCNTNAAATVLYGGHAWRVIGFNGQGVASTQGAITLFAAENIGETVFDDYGHNSNAYASSWLRKMIEGGQLESVLMADCA